MQVWTLAALGAASVVLVALGGRLISMQPWAQWQSEVVALLKRDFVEALVVSLDDIDWPSWRPFYEQGRSPRAAIERALERDL